MEVKYPHKTVGRMMTEKVPTIGLDTTVGDVETLLIKEAANFDSINYIYLLDPAGKLEGVISLKELFRSPKTKLVRDLTPEKVFSIHVHTHQERAALLALQHNLKALPVVDKENNFLGVVASDSILRILDNEAVENILKLGGVSPRAFDNVFSLSLITSLKHRLPWMVVGLFGGMMAAGIIGWFEEVLSENLILAAFIPLIAYMANAVGAQLEVFIIRDFAVNPKFGFVKYFIKQASVVLMIAIVVSSILYGASWFLNHNSNISFVLGISLFFAILTSLLTGLIIPYLFGKIKLDPANASGPIATIIQDSISILVYFYIASIIL